MRAHELNNRIAPKIQQNAHHGGNVGGSILLHDVMASKRDALPSESEPRVQLKLAPGSDRGRYLSDVVSEIASWIFEDRVAVPSQGKGALCICRDCKIWVIEQIVGFQSKRDPGAFPQLETLLQGKVELGERGTAQDISPSIAKLTGSRQCKCARVEPAGGSTYSGAVGTSARIWITNQVRPFRNH